MASSSFDSDHLTSDEVGESDPSDDGVFKSTELTDPGAHNSPENEGVSQVCDSEHTEDNPSPILAYFRTLVLGNHAHIQTEIAAYEKRFYKENNCLPTTENPPPFVNYHRRETVNKLLQ